MEYKQGFHAVPDVANLAPNSIKLNGAFKNQNQTLNFIL